MSQSVTAQTLQQFTDHVSAQPHAMAGAVIAATAAQAVALGRACMQISRQLAGVDAPIAQMDSAQAALLNWCNRDAVVIAEYVALREAGNELGGQQLLCDGPATISQLAIEAANRLQDFRPLVHEQVRDDLEMSLTLLVGAAQAAMLLLDSNLRHWPTPPLLTRYEPIRAGLEQEIRRLRPVARIRG